MHEWFPLMDDLTDIELGFEINDQEMSHQNGHIVFAGRLIIHYIQFIYI